MFELVDLSGSDARRRFRQSIKDEWGCCAYCGKSHSEEGDPLDLTLDHIRPRTYGGSSMRSNLIPACFCCNSRKGSAEWKSWFKAQAFFSAARAARIEVWTEPRHCEVFDHWFLTGGKNESSSTAATGAAIHASSHSSGSSGLFQGRINRGITCLLGGEVQTEANLYCQ